MDAEAVFYERAMRRIYRGIAIAGAAGLVAALWMKGWQAGLAFLIAAAGSYFSFSSLHQAVKALGPEARPMRKRVIAFVALRYVVLFTGVYVIVKVFGMNAIAALAGLFVPVAAVVVEILYELVHERA